MTASDSTCGQPLDQGRLKRENVIIQIHCSIQLEKYIIKGNFFYKLYDELAIERLH